MKSPMDFHTGKTVGTPENHLSWKADVSGSGIGPNGTGAKQEFGECRAIKRNEIESAVGIHQVASWTACLFSRP